MKKKASSLMFNGDWQQIFSSTSRCCFESWWEASGEPVEEGNDRRGGWSEVLRLSETLPDGSDCTFYLKRQQNQSRRGTMSWYLSKPTYWFEREVLARLAAAGRMGPDWVCFGQRWTAEGVQSLLVTRELQGYQPVNDFLCKRIALEDRRRMMRLIGHKLSAMHRLRLEHRSLYTKHIFIDDAITDCRIIDFETSRFRFQAKKAKRNDLERLFRRSSELTPEDQAIILRQYNHSAV